MKCVTDDVDRDVHNNLLCLMRDYMSEYSWNTAWDQVRNQVWDQILGEVWNLAYDELEEQMK